MNNRVSKAYTEMKAAKYNPDGTRKDFSANSVNDINAKTDTKSPENGVAIIGESKIGECILG